MSDEEATAVDGRRPSRWRTFLLVAGIVVAVLAASGIGIVVGRASVTATASGPANDPVVEESPGVEKLVEGNSRSSEQPSAGVEGGAAVSLIVVQAPAQAGSVFLTPTAGLSDTPATASGYRLVNAGISGGQVAGVLASVFGTPGQPVTQDDGWLVGTANGSGPRLIVKDDPLFTWTYDDGSATLAAGGPPMTADRAVVLTTALLGSIGVDTASVDWQVELTDGVTLVTAWQLVAGSRTQLSWQVGFGPDGALVRAKGFSAGFEEVPGYPVVGAASAVQRAGVPPWAAIAPVAVAPPFSDAPAPSASPGSAAGSDARPALSVPVTDVMVTGAELALAQYWQPDGGLLILPSYVLTGQDGSRWSLLAVDESAVQFVEPTDPSADLAAP